MDEHVFEEMNGWVANAKERVRDTLLDSEVFVDMRETKFLIEHEASLDLSAGPAGFDAVLQGREAAGCTRTGLDELLETSGALTQVLGDAEDRTIPITPPDDVSELIMSVEESDLGFAKLEGRSGEERVMTGEEGTGIRGPVSDSRPGSGLATALVPILEDQDGQDMPAERAVDTLALLKVFFPGFGPGRGAQNDERAHVAAATGRKRCGKRPTTR